ncbi:hypothetical protein [Aquimarina pacifica]|uniref:hypothetical protein n=1 Tax=Aquimarina pacifica TaxID=1296415 RepID=UPI00046E5AE5|nr:hypothetical protein [Aquimarina pacifica]
MKTIILKIVCTIPALLLCLSIQSQVDLDADDHNFLDPYDDNGDKWFEDIQDRRDFFNNLVAAIKTNDELYGDMGFVSITEDLFIASVRTDDDRVYDDKNYFLTFSTIYDSFSRSETICCTNSLELDYYRIHFFIGSNISEAQIEVNSQVPAALSNWSDTFATDNFELDLIESNALKSEWLELVPPLQSSLNSLYITGK